jgi:iron complex outermembrane receptor protein
MKDTRKLLSFLLLAPLGAPAQTASVAPPLASETVQLDAFVTTGTRFDGRLIAESPVPIDVLTSAELTADGYAELHHMLRARVPAFSVPNAVGAGAVDFVKAPSLRGLGIGQLLVLVNGKRRHTTGDISTGQQIGRGDVGYDLNAIPAAALGRAEILRDGASAQYGADAIAGVINLTLDRSLGGRLDTHFGTTTKGDGEIADFSAGYGVPLAGKGFLRTTVAYQRHGYTDRSEPDTRQMYFGSGGTVMPSANYGSGTGLTPAAGTLDPREATINRITQRSGNSAYENRTVFVNAELPAGPAATLYAFGGFNRLDGDSPALFRRAAQDETVRALHPNGFLPLAPYELQNHSAAVGARGRTASGWSWDLSTVLGGNRIENNYKNSNNPSYGAASLTDYDRGGTRFDQWTTNLDFTKEFSLGSIAANSAPLKLAFGLEHRADSYEILAGETGSYANGGVPILDGPNAGRIAPVGVQPASGYRPSDTVKKDRSNHAAYIEAEHAFTSRLLLSVAARYEDYSDFGDTTTIKAAGRFVVTKALSLRASASTGFRAPHLAQSWFNNATNTGVNGVLVTARLLSVADPVAKLLGATPLRPEESVNQSAGLVFEHGRLSLSADAYRIRVTDRIALSSNFTGAAVTNLLAAAGYPNITSTSFLTNAADTDTRGAEVTVRYQQPLESFGKLTATFGAMWNKSEFDRVARAPKPLTDLGVTTPLFDLSQQVRYTSGLPRDKFVLSLDWVWKKLSVNLTNIRYGEYEFVGFTSLTPSRIAAVTPGFRYRLAPTDPVSTSSQVIQQFDAKIVTDLEVTFRVTPRLSVSVGANNLFDVYPGRNFASTAASVAAGTNGSDNFGTLPYNFYTPFDWNGTVLFAKIGWKF